MSNFVIYISILFLSGNILAARSLNSNLNIYDNQDWNQYEGVTIDSIVIDNQNIYDTNSVEYNKLFFRLANKFHIKTRISVIKNEILLNPNEGFSIDLAEETLRNIRSRLKVYDAYFEIEKLENGHLKLILYTIDQWSLNTGVELTREGNENKVKIGFEEQNLLGYNKLLSLYFISQTEEKDYIEAGYLDQYILGKKYSLLMNYSTNPVNNIKRVFFAKPFYNLNQVYSFSVQIDYQKGRFDHYENNSIVGSYFSRADMIKTILYYRTGSYHKKTILGFKYKYKYKTYLENYDANQGNVYYNTSNLNLNDSLFHEIGYTFSVIDYSYVTTKNIDGIGYSEDFSKSYSIETSLSRAFTDNFRNHYYNLTYVYLRYNYFRNSLLLFSNFNYHIWFKRYDKLRDYLSVSVQLYKHFSNNYTLAVSNQFILNNDDTGSDFLLLGGTSGVRGYPKYYLTGDKKYVCHLENRFFSDFKFLSMIFGGNVFADWGTIWSSGATTDIYSYGLGLRIGFENVTQNIVRIDFIRTKNNNWEISIGTGQYFRAGHQSFID